MMYENLLQTLFYSFSYQSRSRKQRDDHILQRVFRLGG